MKQTVLFLTCAAATACGSSPDVLYVGAALSDASRPFDGGKSSGTGGPSETGGAIEAGSTEGGAIFDPVCTPVVDYQNLDPLGGGKVFTDNVKSPAAFVQNLTSKICPLLYRSTWEVPWVPTVGLVIGPIADGSNGIASRTIVTLNSDLLATYASTHTASETLYAMSGMTVHLLSHVYQSTGPAPYSVLTGMNDFVRYRTGYFPESARHKGGNWDDGFQTTGFFLAYVDMQSPSFVYRLNQSIRTGYDVSIFQSVTGKDVNTLWAEYQASF